MTMQHSGLIVALSRLHPLQPPKQNLSRGLHKALEAHAAPERLVGQATAAGVIHKRLNPIFRDRVEPTNGVRVHLSTGYPGRTMNLIPRRHRVGNAPGLSGDGPPGPVAAIKHASLD